MPSDEDISFNPAELEAQPPVPPVTTFWRGDKAEYTAVTQDLHGGTFYEIRLRKGTTVDVQRARAEAARPLVTQQRNVS